MQISERHCNSKYMTCSYAILLCGYMKYYYVITQLLRHFKLRAAVRTLFFLPKLVFIVLIFANLYNV